MNKILIIGGCGFIGRNLAVELYKRGYIVTLFDKNTCLDSADPKIKDLIKENIKIIQGDVLNREDIEKSIQGQNYVFHFGAVKNIDESNLNPYKTAEVNILGTINILEACKKYNVNKFLFASSLYAISNYWGGFYATSKIACEKFIERYNIEFGLNYSILRYGSVYGNDADLSNRIIQMINDAFTKKEIVYSNNTSRDFIHINDAISLSIKIMEDKNEYLNKKINIKGNQRLDILTLASTIKEILPFNVKLVESVETTGHYNLTVCKYDNENEIAYTINSEQYVSIDDGIKDCIERYYKQKIENK